MERIYEFINPNNNDLVSKMRGIDLQTLIILLEEYYLELRNKLNFDLSVTYGLEIEIDYANKKLIKDLISQENFHREWSFDEDASLDHGIEVVSPVLVNKNRCWREIDKVCEIINDLGIINDNTGGHIHIGAQILGNKIDYWINFIKLWMSYENVLLRFGYGNFLLPRTTLLEYARPISEILKQDYNYIKNSNISFKRLIDILSHDRYQAVNFFNVNTNHPYKLRYKNTIEFRSPNGTVNSVIWQNNINLFVKLLLYAKNSNFNEDIINKRNIINKDYQNIDLSSEIFLDEALELTDMIFDNNLDKLYFLKQYLKSFQTSKRKNDSKAKILTKKNYF